MKIEIKLTRIGDFGAVVVVDIVVKSSLSLPRTNTTSSTTSSSTHMFAEHMSGSFPWQYTGGAATTTRDLRR